MEMTNRGVDFLDI
ncbi:unnamed protein product, partial [Rotaria magnacalcarata]